MRSFIKGFAAVLLGFLPRPPEARGDALCIRWRLGWLNAWRYRARFRIQACLGGRRVEGGRGLSVQGRLRVRGPGRVVLGDFVVIDGRTDLYTHSPGAVLEVGGGTFLNGSRFGCSQRISVGRRCIVSDARIMDTDFHSVFRERHTKEAPITTSPVRIEDDCWLAAGVFVLRGVTIGEGSVVACGAIVSRDIPAGSIAGGNPAKVISEVPSLVAAAGTGR